MHLTFVSRGEEPSLSQLQGTDFLETVDLKPDPVSLFLL